jgi:glycosyltransferase involved in cell wall biosynthesis
VVIDSPGRPLVSIIVCVYNGQEFLGAALDSVLAQTYPQFELIAIDDGSTDGSADVLNGYADSRFRVLHQENRGAALALDLGLKAATGEFVAFLDQDDLWEKDKLAVHADLLSRRPVIDLTFSWFRYVDRTGRSIGLRRKRYYGTFTFQSLLTDFAIGATSNVVVRRNAIEKAGGVDPAFPGMYDLDLFLRIALLAQHNITAIPAELMLYRRHGRQITRDFASLQCEWERVVSKMARLAPEVVSSVEGRARSNASRFFARLAYEYGNYGKAMQYVGKGFKCAPVRFLTDPRNWSTGAACMAGRVLPPKLHKKLERLAGLRRQ